MIIIVNKLIPIKYSEQCQTPNKHVLSVNYCFYHYLTDFTLFLCFTKMNRFLWSALLISYEEFVQKKNLPH